MKLNKLVALTLTGIMAASLAACGGSKPAETTAAAAPAETKAEAAAPAAAPADGADYSALDDVELILADTSSNGAALQQFNEALAANVDAITGGQLTFAQHLAPFTPAEDILNTLEFDPELLYAALEGGE